MRMEVCVIGAGVIGLSTALALQENIPGVQVTVIGEDFSPDTTGDVAAGIFTPTLDRLKGTPPALVKQMIRDSFRHFHHLMNSAEGGKAGVTKVSGYNLYENPPPKILPYEDVVYCCRPCTEKELSSIPIKYPYGVFVTTILIECRRYLPWLLSRIKENGGKVEQRKINRMDELSGQYQVIVNCTGLGSRELVNDSIITPVRGQAVRVYAPWVKHFYRAVDSNQTISVIPCLDTVHLGSTWKRGSWDLKAYPAERRQLTENCRHLVPSLGGAKFVRDVVGLRPWREPIRMEREVVMSGSHVQQVVHNYGHSSSGVGLSWGAAKHATNMVKEALKMSPLSAKL